MHELLIDPMDTRPVVGLHISNAVITGDRMFVGCSFNSCTIGQPNPVFYHCVFSGETTGFEFSRAKEQWFDLCNHVDKARIARFHRNWVVNGFNPEFMIRGMLLDEAPDLIRNLPTLTTCYGLSSPGYKFLLQEWLKDMWDAEVASIQREEENGEF